MREIQTKLQTMKKVITPAGIQTVTCCGLHQQYFSWRLTVKKYEVYFETDNHWSYTTFSYILKKYGTLGKLEMCAETRKYMYVESNFEWHFFNQKLVSI